MTIVNIECPCCKGSGRLSSYEQHSCDGIPELHYTEARSEICCHCMGAGKVQQEASALVIPEPPSDGRLEAPMRMVEHDPAQHADFMRQMAERLVPRYDSPKSSGSPPVE